MKRSIVVFLVLAFAVTTVVSQRSLKDIEGTWVGTLSIPAGDLRLVFHFEMTEADTIKGTLDSPDQGAMGIPMGRVNFDGDTLVARAPMIRGEYRGLPVGDTLITGRLIQMGAVIDLNVKREAAPVVEFKRPQTPEPPYPYREEEVTFRNPVENFDLAGTLTLPQGEGPFPAVVLITGSGAQDRDETIFYHKPFHVIADHLTRNGIAVLRYDDRGIGKSKGRMNDATTMTLADDAEAAVTYLLQRPEIDHLKIGLAGHSEGGIIAPIVASRNGNIAFIVSLAGPGVRGSEILMRQARDIYTVSGMDEAEMEETLAVNSHLLKMAVEEPDQRQFAKDAMAWYGSELNKQGLSPDQRKEKMAEFTQGLVSVNNPWMRYFIEADPAPFWSQVKCPVLALNGEKDLQVNYEQNLPAIKKALKKGGNRKVKTVAMPGLNHLFQHAGTGSPEEYIKIEETFAPEALEIMTSWIRKTMKMK
jgi:fermentation-respiration switch protein FrsA (DUF1100 family)